MFFIFGFIKYLVLGRDNAYLYYSLIGLSLLLLTIAQSEYPPLEAPFFENLRGIELTNLLITVSSIIQWLFAFEILDLKHKFPRLTRVLKFYLLFKLLISVAVTLSWIVKKRSANFILGRNIRCHV